MERLAKYTSGLLLKVPMVEWTVQWVVNQTIKEMLLDHAESVRIEGQDPWNNKYITGSKERHARWSGFISKNKPC